MDHKQLRENKKNLQEQITNFLLDFEEENDVKISSIDSWFDGASSVSSPNTARFIHLTFKIEI